MMRQSDKPTYLLVLPWPLSSIGGVTQVVMNLYRECERSGKFSPLIMILDFAQSAPAFEVIDGFRCVRLGLAAPANDGWSIRGMLAFARRAPVTMWRLRRLLSSLRVAAVNVLAVMGPAAKVAHPTLQRIQEESDEALKAAAAVAPKTYSTLR